MRLMPDEIMGIARIQVWAAVCRTLSAGASGPMIPLGYTVTTGTPAACMPRAIHSQSTLDAL